MNIDHWKLSIAVRLVQAERYFLFLHNSISNLTLHSGCHCTTSSNNYNYRVLNSYKMQCSILMHWTMRCSTLHCINCALQDSSLGQPFGICIWVCICIGICICVVFSFVFVLYLHLYLCCIAVLALEFGSAPLVSAAVKFQAGSKWPLGHHRLTPILPPGSWWSWWWFGWGWRCCRWCWFGDFDNA